MRSDRIRSRSGFDPKHLITVDLTVDIALHDDPKLPFRICELNLMVIQKRSHFVDPHAKMIKGRELFTLHNVLETSAVQKATAFDVQLLQLGLC